MNATALPIWRASGNAPDASGVQLSHAAAKKPRINAVSPLSRRVATPGALRVADVTSSCGILVADPTAGSGMGVAPTLRHT